MSIKAIVFDLDDTLLDHKGAETRALLEIRSQYPMLQQVIPQQWLTQYAHRNRELWEQYGRGEITRRNLHFRRFNDSITALGIPITETEVHEMGQRYMEAYRRHWEWTEGAERVFRSVSLKTFTGILTNGFKETQRLKLDRFGLDSSSIQVVISEEFGVMKPDRRIFDETHRRISLAAAAKGVSIQPDEMLYVGDSFTSDIIGATGAGWKSAWFRPAGSPGAPSGVASGTVAPSDSASGATSAAAAASDAASADFVFQHFDEFDDLIPLG